MSGGLDQYGAGLFEQQQFITAGVEAVKFGISASFCHLHQLLFSAEEKTASEQ